jgi:hypothetical protein
MDFQQKYNGTGVAGARLVIEPATKQEKAFLEDMFLDLRPNEEGQLPAVIIERETIAGRPVFVVKQSFDERPGSVWNFPTGDGETIESNAEGVFSIKNNGISSGKLSADLLSSLFVRDAAGNVIPKSFVDIWNTAADVYGAFNAVTGYFELNGLTDILYPEALRIYTLTSNLDIRYISKYSFEENLRTNLPFRFGTAVYYSWDLRGFMRYGNVSMEVLNVRNLSVKKEGDANGNFSSGNFDYSFFAPALKEIIGIISSSSSNFTGTFDGAFRCPLLEEMKLKLMKYTTDNNHTINLSYCPRLSFDSFNFLVNKYEDVGGTGSLTIIVTAGIYDKMTNPANADFPAWSNLLSIFQSKNGTFASA